MNSRCRIYEWGMDHMTNKEPTPKSYTLILITGEKYKLECTAFEPDCWDQLNIGCIMMAPKLMCKELTVYEIKDGKKIKSGIQELYLACRACDWRFKRQYPSKRGD